MDFGDFLDRARDEPRRTIFTINWIADYPSPHAIYGLLLEPGAAEQLRRLATTTSSSSCSRRRRARSGGRGRARRTTRSTLGSPSRRRSSRGRTARPGGWSPTGCAGLGNLTIGLIDFGRVSWDD